MAVSLPAGALFSFIASPSPRAARTTASPASSPRTSFSLQADKIEPESSEAGAATSCQSPIVGTDHEICPEIEDRLTAALDRVDEHCAEERRRLGQIPCPLPGVNFPVFPNLLRSYRFPAQPSVDADMTDDQIAVVCEAAFRAVLNNAFPKANRKPPRNLAATRSYRTFVAAGRKLREHELNPYAWAKWSIDQWLELPASKGGVVKPAPGFLFSPTRVDRLRGMFRSQSSVHDGKDEIVPAKIRAVVVRWQSMYAEISRNRGGTVPEQQAIVDRYFPGDSYDRAIAAAKREIEHTLHALRLRRGRGEWIWN